VASAAQGFFWRGRASADDRLNAMTLASGLDDYPRATVPSPDERHLDLYSWLAAAARILAEATAALPGKGTRPSAHYAALHERLLRGLDGLHWDGAHRRYSDVGLTSNEGQLVEHVVIKCKQAHTDEQLQTDVPIAKLRKAGRSPCPASHPHFLFPLGDGQGGLLMRKRWRGRHKARVGFVQHVGYVSLFPLLLKLLPADAPQLGAILDALTDPAQLWSKHGLRSLSAADRFHGVENAPGDAPYWRGPIWVNLNYLALSGLHHYGQQRSPCIRARATCASRQLTSPRRARIRFSRPRSQHARPVCRARARGIRRAARKPGGDDPWPV
jgi:mannosyl-oligosaccharide glucosidase